MQNEQLRLRFAIAALTAVLLTTIISMLCQPFHLYTKRKRQQLQKQLIDQYNQGYLLGISVGQEHGFAAGVKDGYALGIKHNTPPNSRFDLN